MAEVIRMPKMSDTMLEGVIANWLKKEGDVIKSGDIIAEVETDKATMELENYEDGTLLYIGVKVGEAVPVDGIIAIVGKPGEDYSALLAAPAATTSPAPVASEPVAAAVAPAAEAIAASVDLSGVKAAAVRMPKMSDTMIEGVIAKWLKAVGDVVKSGDIIGYTKKSLGNLYNSIKYCYRVCILIKHYKYLVCYKLEYLLRNILCPLIE
jgi:pyruvate dehydrogenase E2 component (dihydrolipoamide acetyltransferase)